MTKQAMNSLDLYKGENPDTIQVALGFQSKSVVNELMGHFGVSDIRSLAMKLSMSR